jgi:hypothetical protein
MKKIYVIFALFTLISLTVTSQPQLTWRFNNVEVVNAGTELQFDVEVKANVAGSFHRDLQIYFDYNTAGFGSDIVANGKISYSPLTLMDVSKYTVVNMADNTSSKFAIITEAINEMAQPGSATYYKEITTSYQGLLRFSIDIASNTATAGIAFDQLLMNGGEYYQSTSNTNPIKYTDPCLYDNNISSLVLSTVYGNITYANGASTPMTNCDATLYQGAVVVDVSPPTNLSGTYYFTGIADGAYTIQTTVVKAKGGITTADGIIAARIAAGLGGPYTAIQLKAADVNNSGGVTTTDGILIKRRAAGLPSNWAAPDYVFEVPSVSAISGMGTVNYKSLCSGDVNGSHVPVL